MAGSARPNDPGGPRLAVADEAVGGLAGESATTATGAMGCGQAVSGSRFHALFDRVCRGDVLREAWKRVCGNSGAAGVDRLTLAAVEDYGVDRMLGELRRDLRQGRIARRRRGGWRSQSQRR